MLGRLFIIFVRVGHVIYVQTIVQCAAFGCNNEIGNSGVEGSGRIIVYSFHSFQIKRPPLLKRWVTKLDWNSSVCPDSSGDYVVSCRIIIRLAFFKYHNENIKDGLDGIRLVRILSEAIPAVILSPGQLYTSLNEMMSEAPAGFRKGYSTTDLIFTLKDGLARLEYYVNAIAIVNLEG